MLGSVRGAFSNGRPYRDPRALRDPERSIDLPPRLADRALALRRGLIVADVAVDAGTPALLRGLLR